MKRLDEYYQQLILRDVLSGKYEKIIFYFRIAVFGFLLFEIWTYNEYFKDLMPKVFHYSRVFRQPDGVVYRNSDLVFTYDMIIVFLFFIFLVFLFVTVLFFSYDVFQRSRIIQRYHDENQALKKQISEL
jgi:hypothetical protein